MNRMARIFSGSRLEDLENQGTSSGIGSHLQPTSNRNSDIRSRKELSSLQPRPKGSNEVHGVRVEDAATQLTSNRNPDIRSRKELSSLQPRREGSNEVHGVRVEDAATQPTSNRNPDIRSRKEPPSLQPRREGSNEVHGVRVEDAATQPSLRTPPKIKRPHQETLEHSWGKLDRDWLEAMRRSDEGMCKGWISEIDTLIVFAGLFAATVTPFAVFTEMPADAMFKASSLSVAIGWLWFVSLALTLIAVFVGFICKQWLHEYQRYDNYTPEEEFLIRGLRYRGLRAWKVPEIIASIPILLLVALMLFLFGIILLLKLSGQAIILFTISAIVGLALLFFIATTFLPAFQYLYPIFETQCPYKSSQSSIPFRLFKFKLFRVSTSGK